MSFLKTQIWNKDDIVLEKWHYKKLALSFTFKQNNKKDTETLGQFSERTLSTFFYTLPKSPCPVSSSSYSSSISSSYQSFFTILCVQRCEYMCISSVFVKPTVYTHLLRIYPSQLPLQVSEMSEQFLEEATLIEKLYEFDKRLSECTDKSQVRFYFT